MRRSNHLRRAQRPPADHSALARSVLATRTPHILEFSEEERGKTVYVAICWQKSQMSKKKETEKKMGKETCYIADYKLHVSFFSRLTVKKNYRFA